MGLGHAERIAEDHANDLALLRLYGARNLAAVALAGDSRAGDDLTLIGVAEPLAQAGGGAVLSGPPRSGPRRASIRRRSPASMGPPRSTPRDVLPAWWR